jgi:alpha-beta hydrolase superfamily lysophospholipase
MEKVQICPMDFLTTTHIGESGVEHIPSADGTKLAVRVAGGKNVRTPLLMLHGLQSHSGWFVQSQTFLAGLGFPVYAMDRRGSGLSEGERGHCSDFRQMIADVSAVAQHALDGSGFKKVHVFGHCFGTIPATLYATAHPEQVSSLIFASSGIFTRISLALTRKLELAWSKAAGREVQIPIPLKPEMFSELTECVSFIGNDELRLRTATASLYYEVRRACQHIQGNRHRLSMPLFMASAGNDPVCDTAANERFFWSLPARHKLLVRYERSRHVIEFSEQRDELFRDLNWWLERFGDERYAKNNPA